MNKFKMDYNDLLLRVSVMSEYDNKNLIETMLKLTEEVGELSQAVLSYSKTDGCEYKNKTKENVLEEIVDVYMITISLLSKMYAYNIFDNKDIFNMFEGKMDKWSKNIVCQESGFNQ